MKADRKRAFGFYWVRIDILTCSTDPSHCEVIVAEYANGFGCLDEVSHWHVPGSDYCYSNREVCELLAGPLAPPVASTEQAKAKA